MALSTSPANAAEQASYVRIRKTLEDEIAHRRSPGNGVLPSEEKLALRFGVNRHTVRRALQGLVDAGLIERRRGLGSLIVYQPDPGATSGRVEYRVNERTRFSQLAGVRGRRTDIRVLGGQRTFAEGEIQQRLRVGSGESVLRLETLRSVDRKRFCLTTHYFPADEVPGLADRYKEGPLHAWLERVYGWTLYRASSAASVALPDKADAAALGITRSQPILIVKSVNLRAGDGRPVEYAITRFRGDRVELYISF